MGTTFALTRRALRLCQLSEDGLLEMVSRQIVRRLWRFRIALPLVDGARQRRIALLMMILWLLAGIDLGLTLWANRYAMLEEFNPIARTLFENGQVKAIIVLKIATLGTGSAIFWATRRRRATEAGLWGLAMVYVLVMFQWSNVTAAADDVAESQRQEARAKIPSIIHWNAYLKELSMRPGKRVDRVTVAAAERRQRLDHAVRREPPPRG